MHPRSTLLVGALSAFLLLPVLLSPSPAIAVEDRPDPICVADCAEHGIQLLQSCVADGGARLDCRRKVTTARVTCVMERCGPGEPPCEDRCRTRANAFYLRCKSSGIDWRECMERKIQVEESCIAQRCDEPCVCPDVFAPVCGADGNTYGNECEARCAGVEIVHEGECRPFFPSCRTDDDCATGEICRIEDDCTCNGQPCTDLDRGCGVCVDCICPDVYDPVCGVDGTTYGNACEARCAHTEVAHEGECGDVCVCPRIFAPVCGVDGVTYPNACNARCAGVDVAHEGPCRDRCPECRTSDDCRAGERCDPQTHTCEPGGGLCAELGVPMEICHLVQCAPSGGDPVCGEDGTTYPNPCLACCGAGVEIAHEGECRDDCPALPCDVFCEFGHVLGPDGCPTCECNEPCFCTEEYNPVCGVDGVTYPNECHARCAGVDIAHDGECRRECQDNDDCPGADQICFPSTKTCQPRCVIDCLVEDPVCGTDGQTYVCGEPDAACNGIEVAHEGPCDCACPAVYDPVCGIDGATYGNRCEAQCASVEIAHAGECPAP